MGRTEGNNGGIQQGLIFGTKSHPYNYEGSSVNFVNTPTKT